MPHEYRRVLSGTGGAKATGGSVSNGQANRIHRVSTSGGGLRAGAGSRLKHYREFVKVLTDEQASVQGARCMDCGIPFCNTGCPVNNIIPDWNDLVYRGNWEQALAVLHSTNNFPDFTGRICPAPCEAACTLNINTEPVGIKSIEHAIVDKGWEQGWIVPQRPQQSRPARSVAVDRLRPGRSGRGAATRARRTCSSRGFEKSDRVGGLLRYGIPDFKLEKSHIDRRVQQMEAEGVEFRVNQEVGGNGSQRRFRRAPIAGRIRCAHSLLEVPSRRAT
jgi:glutamate synthase (NADPH/NADH) small chain